MYEFSIKEYNARAEPGSVTREGSGDGTVVRALASHQSGPGSIPGCSERFFSGFSGFPLSSKTDISKFQFDLDYCQALYRESLAREIAQALPVLFEFIYIIVL